MKWDYFVTDNEEHLWDLGEKEWELVTVIPQDERFVFYFKKPRHTLKERVTEEQRIKVYNRLSPEDVT